MMGEQLDNTIQNLSHILSEEEEGDLDNTSVDTPESSGEEEDRLEGEEDSLVDDDDDEEEGKCSIEGCTKNARDSGKCWGHNGYDFCTGEGCTNKPQKGGVCNRHGANKKTCREIQEEVGGEGEAPPTGNEKEYYAVLGRMKRYASNKGESFHISTAKFEILAQKAYTLHPKNPMEGWKWLWGVIQNQGWKFLVAVDKGYESANVREVEDEEEIKDLIYIGILRHYATKFTPGGRTRFDEAQEQIMALARDYNEIAAYMNEVARMSRADGVLNGGNGGESTGNDDSNLTLDDSLDNENQDSNQGPRRTAKASGGGGGDSSDDSDSDDKSNDKSDEDQNTDDDDDDPNRGRAKENVLVFARIRPFLTGEQGEDSDTPHMSHDENTVSVTKAGDSSQSHKFSFDRVFGPTDTQENVYDGVSKLVQSSLNGYSVCLFSYGQTGSGKTFTMQGAGTDQMRGLIPRSIEEIGAHKLHIEKEGWTFSMDVSFLEIYNEALRDLLREKQTEELKIKVGSHGRRTVTNLTIKPTDPNDKEAVDTILALAAERRSTAATSMNATSSRSHSVFTLHMTSMHEGENKVVRGTLHLVDLAGSERLDRSGAIGQRAKESVAINLSLSCLARVFNAIKKKERHVPFRDSQLTYLLQPALSGDGKMCMFVNISPTETSLQESLYSLLFARNVKKCKFGKAKRMIEEVEQAKRGNSSMSSSAKAPPDLKEADDEEDDSHDDNSEEGTDDDEDDHNSPGSHQGKPKAKVQGGGTGGGGRYDSLKKAIREMEEEDAKEAEILEDEKQELFDENQTLKKENRILQNEVDEVQTSLADVQEELRKTKDAYEEEKEGLNEMDREAQTEIDKLKQEKANRDATIGNLEATVAEQDTTIRSLTMEKADQDTTIETLESDKTSLTGHIQTKDERIEELEEQLADARTGRDRDARVAAANAAQQQTTIEDLRGRLERLQEQIDAAKEIFGVEV